MGEWSTDTRDLVAATIAAHVDQIKGRSGEGNWGADFFAEAPGCLSCDPGKSWPCPTLRALALPYADRDGYDESWRP